MFDLYITFSGICLFAYRDSASPVHVLLPHTPSHHRHVPVLGWPEIHQSGSTVGSMQGYMEHELGGDVHLPPLQTSEGLDPNFDGLGVIDISDITDKPPLLSVAAVRLSLPKGGVCRECDHHPGGRWKVEWDEIEPLNGQTTRSRKTIYERMAARLHWKIGGLKNQVRTPQGLADGLTVTFQGAAGARSVDLHARDGRVRMYLFHTLDQERPSRGTPRFESFKQDDPSPHFEFYYTLFDRPEAQPVPLFAPPESIVPAPQFFSSARHFLSPKLLVGGVAFMTACTVSRAKY